MTILKILNIYLSVLILLKKVNSESVGAMGGSSGQKLHRRNLNPFKYDLQNWNQTSDLDIKSSSVSSQELKDNSTLQKSGLEGSACLCMDYWECAVRHGQVYSYCGISDSEVCCFLNHPPKDNGNQTIIESPLEDSEKESTITAESNTTPQPQITIAIENKSLESLESLGKCGIASIPVQLDSKAQFKEWPWHVAILEATEDLYICGGSLIFNDKVITAAHCLTAYIDKPNLKLKVRAGEYDVSGNHEQDPHVEVFIDSILIHPNFDNVTLRNDIAIVSLEEKIVYAENIQPLCLPFAQPLRRRVAFENQSCIVTGWGRRSKDSPHSVVLKEVSVKLWPKDRCEGRLQKNFGSNFHLPPTSLCASDQNKNKNEFGEVLGVCEGDGGGPLACFNKLDSKWYQRGIVSFGIDCGEINSPGIYTRISSYINWISQIIKT